MNVLFVIIFHSLKTFPFAPHDLKMLTKMTFRGMARLSICLEKKNPRTAFVGEFH